MRRIVVAGWVGAGNLGDELIHLALATKLRAQGASVVSVSRNPDDTAALHGTEAVSSQSLRRALGRADGLVFGGGSLLQDETSPFNLPYHLRRVRAARRAKVPVVVVGIGAGPLERPGSRPLVARALAGVASITSRDQESADLLRDAGVGPVRVAADPALMLEASSTPADRLIVSIRPPISNSILPVGWRKTMHADEAWISRVAHAIDAAAGRLGLRPHLVLMSPRQDGPVTRAVADAMSLVPTIEAPALKDVLRVLGSGRAMIAMRYHAAIGALLAATPCAVLDYSPKMDALVRDAGPGFQRVSLGDVESVSEAITAAIARQQSLPGALDRLRERERQNDDALSLLV